MIFVSLLRYFNIQVALLIGSRRASLSIVSLFDSTKPVCSSPDFDSSARILYTCQLISSPARYISSRVAFSRLEALLLGRLVMLS